VFALVAPLFQKAVGADIVPDLIKFWESVRNGWMPPETLTKQRYMELLEEGPSALRAWAGFAASYNGRWWGGYGPKASGRDYLAESVRSTRKKAVGMRATGVSFRCSSFEYHDADSNTVVYCDIPYQKDSGNNHSGLRVPYGVTGHKIYGSGDFDYALFWQTAEAWVAHGALVLVHEYTVPDGWVPVAQTTRVETMNHRRESSGGRKETLWMHPASLVEK
jgi:DNA adenine methylase